MFAATTFGSRINTGRVLREFAFIQLMVDRARFWNMVESCRQVSQSDLALFLHHWDHALRGLSEFELLQVNEHLEDTLVEMSSWDLFAASWHLSHGGATDFLPRFAEWVVLHGSEAVDRVVKSPEAVPSLKMARGRWSDTSLLRATTRHAVLRGNISARARMQIQSMEDEYWARVGFKLAGWRRDHSEPKQLVLALESVSPIQLSDVDTMFPKFARFSTSRHFHPAYDRRLQMDECKFWAMVEEAKGSPLPKLMLDTLLAAHPVKHQVRFHELWAEIREQVLSSEWSNRSEDRLADSDWLLSQGRAMVQFALTEPHSTVWETVRPGQEGQHVPIGEEAA